MREVFVHFQKKLSVRGSARSIAATMTFMATASVTVFVLRHVVGS